MNERLISFALTSSSEKKNLITVNWIFNSQSAFVELDSRYSIVWRTAKIKNVDSYGIQMNSYEAKEIRIKMKEGEKREIGCPSPGIALQSLLLGPSRELDKHSMHLARFFLKARLSLLPCHLFGPGPLSFVHRSRLMSIVPLVVD